jgi:hypothetical protein
MSTINEGFLGHSSQGIIPQRGESPVTDAAPTIPIVIPVQNPSEASNLDRLKIESISSNLCAWEMAANICKVVIPFFGAIGCFMAIPFSGGGALPVGYFLFGVAFTALGTWNIDAKAASYFRVNDKNTLQN